jgi:hypothetical protein
LSCPGNEVKCGMAPCGSYTAERQSSISFIAHVCMSDLLDVQRPFRVIIHAQIFFLQHEAVSTHTYIYSPVNAGPLSCLPYLRRPLSFLFWPFSSSDTGLLPVLFRMEQSPNTTLNLLHGSRNHERLPEGGGTNLSPRLSHPVRYGYMFFCIGR